MCKELCDQSEDGSMQSCQDCGCLICFDEEGTGDDVIRPAYVTASGDVYCCQCGSSHDRAEEEADDDEWLGDMEEEAREKAVFTHCNVCGIALRYPAEFRMGMCERCAAE